MKEGDRGRSGIEVGLGIVGRGDFGLGHFELELLVVLLAGDILHMVGRVA